MIVVSLSPAETAAVGERLAPTLGPGDVVALRGDLGAGKTCFAQGVARGLGVTARVSSPTFTMVKEYRVAAGDGVRSVHHVDAYRIEQYVDLMDLGLEEAFDGDGVTLVEWAEKLGPLLPARAIDVHLAGAGHEPRLITITRPCRF